MCVQGKGIERALRNEKGRREDVKEGREGRREKKRRKGKERKERKVRGENRVSECVEKRERREGWKGRERCDFSRRVTLKNSFFFFSAVNRVSFVE